MALNLSSLKGLFGKLKPAAKTIANYGDNAAGAVANYGDDALNFIANNGDDVVDSFKEFTFPKGVEAYDWVQQVTNSGQPAQQILDRLMEAQHGVADNFIMEDLVENASKMSNTMSLQNIVDNAHKYVYPDVATPRFLDKASLYASDNASSFKLPDAEYASPKLVQLHDSLKNIAKQNSSKVLDTIGDMTPNNTYGAILNHKNARTRNFIK